MIQKISCMHLCFFWILKFGIDHIADHLDNFRYNRLRYVSASTIKELLIHDQVQWILSLKGKKRAVGLKLLLILHLGFKTLFYIRLSEFFVVRICI